MSVAAKIVPAKTLWKDTTCKRIENGYDWLLFASGGKLNESEYLHTSSLISNAALYDRNIKISA